MELLEQAMCNLLREKMQLFIHRISIRYQIEEEDLKNLFQDSSEAETEENAKDIKFCNHKFTKGKRIGMTCLQKISSISSGKCSKHQPKKTKSKHEANEATFSAITGSDEELSIPDTFNEMSVALLHSDDELNSE